jgi:APA family basic amino acid/polyamine antiporter
MMYSLGWVNWLRLIVWLAIGMVIYFTYSIKHSRLQRGELTVPESPKAPSFAD